MSTKSQQEAIRALLPQETAGEAAEIRSAATTQSPADLSRLGVQQESGVAGLVKRHVTTIPIRKPDKFTWFRTQSYSTDRMVGATVIYDKPTGDVFLVSPDIAGALAIYTSRVFLFPVITSQGTLYLWIVPGLDSDSGICPGNDSAHVAAALSSTRWTRIAWNRQLRAYDVFSASEALGEPQWPDLTLPQIVQTAFRGKVITSLRHLVVRRLRLR